MTKNSFIPRIARTHNFVLLQWLMVEGIEWRSLKILFRRTRPTSTDCPTMQAMHVR
jgi:hypothetical protein